MIATPTCYRAPAALVALLGTAFLGLSLLGGCAGGGNQCGACGPRGDRGGGGYFGLPPTICFGYSSTCWHSWPTECTACPAYTLSPQSAEPMPAKEVPPEPALPPMEVTPLPADAAPVPEPSPSDESPAAENTPAPASNPAPANAPAPEDKQSRRRPAPALSSDETPTPAYQSLLPAEYEPVPEPAAPAIQPSVPLVQNEQSEPPVMTPPAPVSVPAPMSAPSVTATTERPRIQTEWPTLPIESPATLSEPQPSPQPVQPSAVAKRSRRALPAMLDLTKSTPAPQAKAAQIPPAVTAEPAVPSDTFDTAISPLGPPPPVLTEPPTSPAANSVSFERPPILTALLSKPSSAAQHSPEIYSAPPPVVSERAPQRVFAKRPRFQLPALFNLVTAPPALKSRPRQQAVAAPIEAAPAAVHEAPAAMASPFGPPPPVLVEPPPAPAELAAPIQVTNYKAALDTPASGPAVIINNTSPFAHQPPPPVLIEPPSGEATFVEAHPLDTTISDAEIAPAPASASTESLPSHILTDWRVAEQPRAPLVANHEPSRLPEVQPQFAPPPAEEHLAPIVSPASVMRRLPPVRAR